MLEARRNDRALIQTIDQDSLGAGTDLFLPLQSEVLPHR